MHASRPTESLQNVILSWFSTEETGNVLSNNPAQADLSPISALVSDFEYTSGSESTFWVASVAASCAAAAAFSAFWAFCAPAVTSAESPVYLSSASMAVLESRLSAMSR